MTPKETVLAYYNALLHPEEISRYVHRDMYIQWHSVRGFIEIDSNEIIVFAKQSQKNYLSLRLEISHCIEEGNQVAVRYTNYITTPESPYEEKVLFHSVAFWELKDGLMYKGYVVSHED
ncbi:nuclear transport factor 2 family protein [Flavobacterium sp. Sd200]|uniref:nuclear transport factor 2 family protein n=1 Tax=Flavobacterium sp. Sd200 TaxID=2692211 RepID=UPI00136E0E9E|nr:nuclear transport factor 2 family protein [Flavobacterium sp. Sd200]MXN90733.1 nuclear transport factor 2 family protein [Flavobacterium sp. Sd200]